MKKLFTGLAILSSFSAFAFDCTSLKDFSNADLDVAVKLAQSYGVEQIRSSGKNVTNQIRAERDLELDLTECKKAALDAKIAELLEAVKN